MIVTVEFRLMTHLVDATRRQLGAHALLLGPTREAERAGMLPHYPRLRVMRGTPMAGETALKGGADVPFNTYGLGIALGTPSKDAQPIIRPDHLTLLSKPLFEGASIDPVHLLPMPPLVDRGVVTRVSLLSGELTGVWGDFRPWRSAGGTLTISAGFDWRFTLDSADRLALNWEGTNGELLPTSVTPDGEVIVLQFTNGHSPELQCPHAKPPHKDETAPDMAMHFELFPPSRRPTFVPPVWQGGGTDAPMEIVVSCSPTCGCGGSDL